MTQRKKSEPGRQPLPQWVIGRPTEILLVGPPGGRRYIEYYIQPWVMVYWFKITLPSGKQTWLQKMATNWDKDKQCFTGDLCPYQALAELHDVKPRRVRADVEIKFLNDFHFELLEDAMKEAERLTFMILPET